jgi:hypothetical protein
MMDARVKPAHDERVALGTAPALQRTASQELRHSASKTRVNALMALRPGHGTIDSSCAGLSAKRVFALYDPRIHRSSQEPFEED